MSVAAMAFAFLLGPWKWISPGVLRPLAKPSKTNPQIAKQKTHAKDLWRGFRKMFFEKSTTKK
jgi:hypothetical protein